MSSADGWDLTVPEDAAELLAELRRHGVKPGQRLHVVVCELTAPGVPSDKVGTTTNGERSDERAAETSQRRDMPSIGSVAGGSRRPLRGALGNRDGSPSGDDFQAASDEAPADAEGRHQDGGPWDLGR